MYLRRLEQRCMKEQKEIEKMNQTQQLLWLINNILICYEGEIHGNDSKSSTSYITKESTVITKNTGRKVLCSSIHGHYNHGKLITLCKVPAHIRGNEEADKTAKQGIDMPGMTTTRLPHTDYNLTIKGG